MGIDFALQQIKNVALVAAIALMLLSLETSPFTTFRDMLHSMESLRVFLEYVNYYVPFSLFAGITSSWLIAMGAFYGSTFMIKVLKAQL